MARTRTTIQKQYPDTVEGIVQDIQDNAFNQDWKRVVKEKYSERFPIIVNKRFNKQIEPKTVEAMIIYGEFLGKEMSPSDGHSFVGFVAITIPESHYRFTEPVIHYTGDTWSKTIANRAKLIDRITTNLEYQGCFVCGSYKQPEIVKSVRRRAELVVVTYRCPDCGHKEQDYID